MSHAPSLDSRDEMLLARLLSAGESLAGALTREHVADVVLAECVEAFGAPAAAIFLVEGDVLRVLRLYGVSVRDAATLDGRRIDAPDWPTGDAALRGESLFLESEADVTARYPGAFGLPGVSGLRGGIARVPMDAGGRVVGVLGLSFAGARPFSETERSFLLSFAHQCALALDRARLFESEQAARKRADFIAEATALLTRAFDDEATLSRIARLAVPAIADGCVVHVVDETGGLTRAAMAGRSVGRDGPDDPLAPIASIVAGSGRGALISDLTGRSPAPLDGIDADALAGARRAGGRSAIVVPLPSRGRSLGAITLLAASSRQRYGEEDLALAVDLARRTGVAIESARLYRAQHRLAREARTRAAELEAVIQAIGDPVIVTDAAGHIHLANQAARAWFGGPELISYRQILSRLRDPDAAPLPGLAARQGPVEIQLRNDDRWVELTAYPAGGGDEDAAVDEDGVGPASGTTTERQGRGTIIVVRDVTDLRQAQQLRDAFIGVLSHELRTPITTIYGGSRVLVRPGLAEETRREVALDVQAEAERLHRLVEDLLVLARAERGRLDIGRDPVLLQHVLPGVTASEQARWPETSFESSVPSAMPAVAAEETYVEQVIRNLLGNAAKYSPPGTAVEVVVEPLEGEVAVRILDEGPGFPAEEANRLFDLFYRSPTTAASSAGAGIGLFVCKALVDAMGGRIWAAPRPAGGAEFGFALRVFEEDPG